MLYTGILRNDAEGLAVKEAPSSPMADHDFKIKAFGAEEDTEAEQKPVTDISSSIERKESLTKVHGHQLYALLHCQINCS